MEKVTWKGALQLGWANGVNNLQATPLLPAAMQGSTAGAQPDDQSGL